MKKYIFGVFRKGNLLFMIGQPITCSDSVAALIVGILDLAKDSLIKGDYFAADYWRLTS
uniref:Uncharacterized protein n=1 Tax=viral metagenome TaxID=1070528 RepID=A0A6M3L306_9ZZZZ